MPALERILAGIDQWGAGHAAAAVIGSGGLIASHGDPDRLYRWASVTKPLTALAVLVNAHEGLVDLDEPAGPPGSTIRHLLAHASGLPFEGEAVLATPGTRRIYSNPAYDLVGALVAQRAALPFGQVLTASVLDPLGMGSTRLVGRPSEGLEGPLSDLVAFAIETLRPTLFAEGTFTLATTVAFPGIPGVVPGVGRFDPCDWGFGFEVHDGKTPHWMGGANSPATFGHFGGTGTFLWVDPVAEVGLAVLSDRPFGRWALEAWPRFADAVLGAVRRR